MARPKTMSTRKILSMPEDLVKRIDEYRFAQRIDSEAEAIRQLLELGMERGFLEDVSQNLARAADDWRCRQHDFPSRQEAVYRLVMRGLLYDALWDRVIEMADEGVVARGVVEGVAERIAEARTTLATRLRLTEDFPESRKF